MDRNVKYLKLVLLFLFSSSAIASQCIKDLNNESVFTIIQRGNAVSYPFKSSHLIKGEHEPVLKHSVLSSKDKDLILKRSNLFYTQSIEAGSVKNLIINGNSATIQFRGPNSGWHVTWFFINKNNCWLLNGLQDQST